MVCVRLPLPREKPPLWEGFIMRSPEATSAKKEVLSWLLRLLSNVWRFVFCVQASQSALRASGGARPYNSQNAKYFARRELGVRAAVLVFRRGELCSPANVFVGASASAARNADCEAFPLPWRGVKPPKAV
jgi:hypothetical protein